MVLLSSNRIAWEYTADDGTVYRVAAQKALTDQAKLGGQAWAGSAPAKPGSLKMRRMTCHAAGQGSVTVPVYQVTAPIVTAETSINVNKGGDQHAFTSTGKIIPEYPRRATPVTTQST